MFYPTIGYVQKIHSYIIKSEGGSDGILSESLLESAIDRPKTRIAGYEPYSGTIRKAVAMSYAIIKWHPFVDGNKRTAVYVLIDFLYTNWINISVPVYMAKYTISVASDEASLGHMSEEDFYKKVVPLCSRNLLVKFIKDLRYKYWTEFRFKTAMWLGETMFKAVNDMERRPNSYFAKRYLAYINGQIKSKEDLFRIFFSRPIDWYGAGDMIIFLTRMREITERREQGYPRTNVPFPTDEENDYVEIR